MYASANRCSQLVRVVARSYYGSLLPVGAMSPFKLLAFAIWGARCLHFGTLGINFGTLGAPRGTILAPQDYPGGPWEPQDGHERARNRMTESTPRSDLSCSGKASAF